MAMPPKARKAYNKVVAPPSEGLMTTCLSGLRGRISTIRAVLADYGLPTRAIVNIECIQMNQILLTTHGCYTTELMEAITRLCGVKHEKENTRMFEESSLYTKEEMERIRHRIETNLSIRVASIWHAQPAIRVQLVEAAKALGVTLWSTDRMMEYIRTERTKKQGPPPKTRKEAEKQVATPRRKAPQLPPKPPAPAAVAQSVPDALSDNEDGKVLTDDPLSAAPPRPPQGTRNNPTNAGKELLQPPASSA
ncbi:hypothetical protein GQ54DRAFT_314988 [Martensiomyces pterosporus]|nr:hypothetical protein GQ54DRAFT_314988 [Martensiomyces pterosporus]